VRRFAVFAMVVAVPGTASAGRSFYGWLQSTEVMPERGAEIATFMSEENYLADQNNLRDTTWWIAPSIGINDQLELTLPVEFQWDRADGGPPRSVLSEYGVDLKYRFVSADPVDKPDFVPAVRARVQRIVTGPRDVVDARVDFIATYDAGPAQFAINVGAQALIGPNDQEYQGLPGLGVSIETVPDLRLGAEVFGEIGLNDVGVNNLNYTWVAVGPNMAWSHGRTWVSAAYGIGLYHVRDAPKLNWGIAF
jgi:hypothetical protein